MKNETNSVNLQDEIRKLVLKDDVQKLYELLTDSHYSSQEKAEALNDTAKKTTPLMIAIVNDNPKMIALLVENGADVNQTCSGMKPLDLAIEKGRVELIKALNINKEVDFETPNLYGIPPIVHAINKEKFQIASHLIDSGASITQRVAKTPFDAMSSAISTDFDRSDAKDFIKENAKDPTKTKKVVESIEKVKNFDELMDKMVNKKHNVFFYEAMNKSNKDERDGEIQQVIDIYDKYSSFTRNPKAVTMTYNEKPHEYHPSEVSKILKKNIQLSERAGLITSSIKDEKKHEQALDKFVTLKTSFTQDESKTYKRANELLQKANLKKESFEKFKNLKISPTSVNINKHQKALIDNKSKPSQKRGL